MRCTELHRNFVPQGEDFYISINRSYWAFVRKEVASNCKKLSWAGTKQEDRCQKSDVRFFCFLSSVLVCSQWQVYVNFC